jgi:hypothetical protein
MLNAAVTGANVPEVTKLFQVLASMMPVGGKPGPKRQKPEAFQNYRGYDSERARQILRRLEIAPVLAGRFTEHESGLGGHCQTTVRQPHPADAYHFST